MLRVNIVQARRGMVLAQPVYHPLRHDTVLLKAGIALDDHIISRLREIQARELWIRFPHLDFLAQYVSPAVTQARTRIASHLSEVYESVVRDAHARLEYWTYKSAVAQLLEKLMENPHAQLFIEEMVDYDHPGLRHGATVCFLSVLLGLKLEPYLVHQRSRLRVSSARDVSNLGVGAMLHDVGMLRLPEPVLRRWNSTHDESDREWRRHVHIGHDMVRGVIEPTAAAVVMHHHQKFDGSGFPAKRRLDGVEEPVAGQSIHIYSRIVAAADLFDRLRHPPARSGAAEPLPVVRVLRSLRERPYRDWIDPLVFKALIHVAPPYPPGSIVRLSSGQSAVVTEWFPEDPCRPNVETIGEADNAYEIEDARRERIILRQRADLHVVHAEGQNVSADNFHADQPAEFDLALALKVLENQAPALEEARPKPAAA